MAEVLLNIEEKNEAEMVADFLGTLNDGQKKEFLVFLQGAKFAKALESKEQQRTA